MPRGRRNRYRLNYKVWFAHGSLASTQDRDLTPAEMVARLREAAKEFESYASSIETEAAKPEAERKL